MAKLTVRRMRREMNYTMIITWDGDVEPFTASFDSLTTVSQIVSIAVSESGTSIRTILIEPNTE